MTIASVRQGVEELRDEGYRAVCAGHDVLAGRLTDMGYEIFELYARYHD